VEVELNILAVLIHSLMILACLDTIKDKSCPRYTGDFDETHEAKCARALICAGRHLESSSVYLESGGCGFRCTL
jgi:hypothetical protein